MKRIRLKNTVNAFVLVDDEDYNELNKNNWTLSSGHAIRNVRSGGRNYTVHMARQIMNYPKGLEVDHKNNDPLDNQKENLRICTHQQNIENSLPTRGRDSKCKGVCLHKRCSKWQAQIYFNGKSIYLGLFNVKEDAARAYDKKALELFGDYARTNF